MGLLYESDEEAVYRSCPPDCPNQHEEWGCDNPEHNSDPAWLSQSLDRNLVECIFNPVIFNACKPKEQQRMLDELKRKAHKPWVRRELEWNRDQLEKRLELVKSFL